MDAESAQAKVDQSPPPRRDPFVLRRAHSDGHQHVPSHLVEHWVPDSSLSPSPAASPGLSDGDGSGGGGGGGRGGRQERTGAADGIIRRVRSSADLQGLVEVSSAFWPGEMMQLEAYREQGQEQQPRRRERRGSRDVQRGSDLPHVPAFSDDADDDEDEEHGDGARYGGRGGMRHRQEPSFVQRAREQLRLLPSPSPPPLHSPFESIPEGIGPPEPSFVQRARRGVTETRHLLQHDADDDVGGSVQEHGNGRGRVHVQSATFASYGDDDDDGGGAGEDTSVAPHFGTYAQDEARPGLGTGLSQTQALEAQRALTTREAPTRRQLERQVRRTRSNSVHKDMFRLRLPDARASKSDVDHKPGSSKSMSRSRSHSFSLYRGEYGWRQRKNVPSNVRPRALRDPHLDPYLLFKTPSHRRPPPGQSRIKRRYSFPPTGIMSDLPKSDGPAMHPLTRRLNPREQAGLEYYRRHRRRGQSHDMSGDRPGHSRKRTTLYSIMGLDRRRRGSLLPVALGVENPDVERPWGQRVPWRRLPPLRCGAAMLRFAGYMYSNFLGPVPSWYKTCIIFFLLLNVVVTFAAGKYAAGWCVVLEFVFTLINSLRCYPLQPGGLLAIEAVMLGLTSTASVIHEVESELPVLLLLLFLETAMYFVRQLLLFSFNKLFIRVKSKAALSLIFLLSTTFLSAFMDALTVGAVVISISIGFYAIFHKVATHHGKLIAEAKAALPGDGKRKSATRGVGQQNLPPTVVEGVEEEAGGTGANKAGSNSNSNSNSSGSSSSSSSSSSSESEASLYRLVGGDSHIARHSAAWGAAGRGMLRRRRRWRGGSGHMSRRSRVESYGYNLPERASGDALEVHSAGELSESEDDPHRRSPYAEEPLPSPLGSDAGDACSDSGGKSRDNTLDHESSALIDDAISKHRSHRHHPHDLADDSHLTSKDREYLDDFRAYLRSMVIHTMAGAAVGGSATLVGEPQNLLIGEKAGWTFSEYVSRQAPVTVPVLVAAILVCVVLEKFQLFGFGQPLPTRVTVVLERVAEAEYSAQTPESRVALAVQLVALLWLFGAVGAQLAEVGLIGLSVTIVITSVNGVIRGEKIAEAFMEVMPFVSLIIVFFAVSSVVHTQGLLTSIVRSLLDWDGKVQLVLFYTSVGILSLLSNSIFVAAVCMRELEYDLRAGTLGEERFGLLAIALSSGTNIPSIGLPNGQASLLFLLTHPISGLLKFSFFSIAKMMLPYTVVLSSVGLIMCVFLADSTQVMRDWGLVSEATPS